MTRTYVECPVSPATHAEHVDAVALELCAVPAVVEPVTHADGMPIVALPAMRAAIYKHPTIGDLYDRLSVQLYAMGYAEQVFEVSKQPQQIAEPASGWISVDERLPASGEAVLLDIGKKTPLRAMWVAKLTLEAGNFEGDTDYDEVTDEYYWPEGWYEWNHSEEVHWAVIEIPRHWMPLPAPPPPTPTKEPS